MKALAEDVPLDRQAALSICPLPIPSAVVLDKRCAVLFYFAANTLIYHPLAALSEKSANTR